MVSLINKTKRIAERSDTNCDTHTYCTHTHTHTHRQSTLDKYMINDQMSAEDEDHIYTYSHTGVL